MSLCPRQPRPVREVSTRGLTPARSVEEVLTAPYEALRVSRTEPPPAGRRPPVESDLRRPLPPPQPSPRRPPPLLARDSGYSEVLAAGHEEVAEAAPLLSRLSVDTGTEEDWVQPKSVAAASQGRSEGYAATNTTHEVTCPHCGTVFAVTEHLLYLNHIDECPERRRRRRPFPS